MNTVDPIRSRPLPEAVDQAATAPAGASVAFRRLLERLEGLAPATAPDVATPDDLPGALRRAEDDYLAAMDLRRRLEEAIRTGR